MAHATGPKYSDGLLIKPKKKEVTIASMTKKEYAKWRANSAEVKAMQSGRSKPPVGPAAVKEYQRQVSPAGVKAAEVKARAALAKRNAPKSKPSPRTTSK